MAQSEWYSDSWMFGLSCGTRVNQKHFVWHHGCWNQTLLTARGKKQRETNNHTFDLDMAEILSSTLDENLGKSVATRTGCENRLNNEHISPIQEILQSPSTSDRKFKRSTEKMPFVITCRTWKAWFQEKENKKKKKNNLLNWKERRREKKTSGKRHSM